MFARSIPFGLSDALNKTKGRWSSLGFRGDLRPAHSPWTIAKTHSVSRSARRAQEAYVLCKPNIAQHRRLHWAPLARKDTGLWHACDVHSPIASCGTSKYHRSFHRIFGRKAAWRYGRKPNSRCDLALCSDPSYNCVPDERSVQKGEKRRISRHCGTENCFGMRSAVLIYYILSIQSQTHVPRYNDSNSFKKVKAC